jgi:hypothetical protein
LRRLTASALGRFEVTGMMLLLDLRDATRIKVSTPQVLATS